jgi:hypothetical protein
MGAAPLHELAVVGEEFDEGATCTDALCRCHQ